MHSIVREQLNLRSPAGTNKNMYLETVRYRSSRKKNSNTAFTVTFYVFFTREGGRSRECAGTRKNSS